MSTPELYEIWDGIATIYMQETAKDDPGRCFSVIAKPGEVIIVPPGWAHATVNADPGSPMTFGAWCVRDFGFEYAEVIQHKGLAWYPLIDDKDGNELQLRWERNHEYRESSLISKSPRLYTELGFQPGVPIYTQYQQTPELFMFVAQPSRIQDWDRFIP